MATEDYFDMGADAESCDGCMEDFSSDEVAFLGCDHIYCRVCTYAQINNFIKDETHIEPRCCGYPIFEGVQHILSPETRSQYEKKIDEHRIPKIYCSRASCSAVLSKSDVEGGVATCPECKQRTCMGCKMEVHEGECKTDEDRQQFIDFAKNCGWQKCYLCGEMVEKMEGCNHMVCICNAEWCYNCGSELDECCCGRQSDE